MIFYTLRLTIRNLFRQNLFTGINIFGLAVGIATSILILLFILDEMSYDSYHEDVDRIFRVEEKIGYKEESSHWAATPGNMGPMLLERYEEIETSIRILPLYNATIMKRGNLYFNEQQMIMADSNLFDLFTWNFIYGDKKSCLDKPGSLVMTESSAMKYFGKTDVVGEELNTNYHHYKVTAVIEDIPANSHFHFNMVAPLSTLGYKFRSNKLSNASAFYTYVRFTEETEIDEFRIKMQDDVMSFFQLDQDSLEQLGITDFYAEILFNPIREIHLNGDAEKEWLWETNTSWNQINMLALTAILLFLIACMNYMNLFTARSLKRAHEVGIRKVLGASRYRIFGHLMIESAVISLFSIFLALGLIELVLPFFNEYIGKELSLSLSGQPFIVPGLFLVLILIAALSGLYPSLYLSKFSPVSTLNQNFYATIRRGSSLWTRRTLVLLQISISVGLIIASLQINRQLNFIEDKDPGFVKENAMVVQFPGGMIYEQFEKLEQQISQIDGVESVGFSSDIPGNRIGILTVKVPDMVYDYPELINPDSLIGMRTMSVDRSIVDALGFNVVEGRDFNFSDISDSTSAFLINESVVEELGLEDPVGKSFEYHYALDTPKMGKIIGVLSDFHYQSMHKEIDPVVLHIQPVYCRYMVVRMADNTEFAQAEKEIKKVWTGLVPNIPFSSEYIQNTYDEMYKYDESLRTIFFYFTFLTLLIASLGLFGLIMYIIEQRMKNLAIRKVLGAGNSSLALSITKEFFLLTIIANIMVWIPVYFLMDEWFSRFAFKVESSWYIYLMALGISIVITFLSVSFVTVRAVKINPSEILKYD